MTNTDKKQQIQILNKSRNNLLLVIAFTVINLALIYFDAEVNFLFSATIPQFVLEVAKNVAANIGENIIIIIGLVIAVITVLPYFIFWILANRTRVLILVAFIFFCIDSILLVYFIFYEEFNFSLIMTIIFHVWILYYLFTGVRAWYKLRGVSSEEYNTLLHEIKIGTYITRNETNEENNPSDKENLFPDKENNFTNEENKPSNE